MCAPPPPPTRRYLPPPTARDPCAISPARLRRLDLCNCCPALTLTPAPTCVHRTTPPPQAIGYGNKEYIDGTRLNPAVIDLNAVRMPQVEELAERQLRLADGP